VTLASLLFAAGFETITNLFGNGLLALLRNPDQFALLRTDASLFANLPDEFLRYDGTAQLVSRVTEPSVEVGGERGILLDTVRAATVTATTHMITYAISRDRLRAGRRQPGGARLDARRDGPPVPDAAMMSISSPGGVGPMPA